MFRTNNECFIFITIYACSLLLTQAYIANNHKQSTALLLLLPPSITITHSERCTANLNTTPVAYSLVVTPLLFFLYVVGWFKFEDET
jgi:hypothetical protein